MSETINNYVPPAPVPDGDTGEPVRYVLGVPFDSTSGKVVTLVKKRGPRHLFNKITFPGGKLHLEETPEEAMSREFHEETGVYIPAVDWTLFEVVSDNYHSIHKFTVDAPEIIEAKTMEDETVACPNVLQALLDCAKNPDAYAADFKLHLLRAIGILGWSRSTGLSPAIDRLGPSQRLRSATVHN